MNRGHLKSVRQRLQEVLRPEFRSLYGICYEVVSLAPCDVRLWLLERMQS
jgi:hypothetical protein